MDLQFDRNKLHDALSAFHTLTGLKVSILKAYDETIMAIPADICALCRKKQADPEFLKRCVETDRQACAAADLSDDIYIYKCHYNLFEAIQTIKPDGVVSGYIMLGQMCASKDDFIKANNPSQEELALLNEIPALSKEKLMAAAKLFSWLGKYLILNKDIKARHKGSVKAIVQYFEQNLADKITVGDLCARFHYSKTALYNLFKKEFNQGPLEYLNHIRLEKSKTLLKSNKICEIANLVGFPDNNYFSRIFKKKYGASPRKYMS